MSETMTKNRELVLPPGTYAFVLDNTKGKVSVCVGPFKNSLSDTDQLVRWDPENQRYQNANNTPGEQQSFAVAEQGQYIVLTNPAPGLTHPNNGMSNDAVDLEVGRRVIVPGPASFPLWPGQTAQTIEGHHLRHNQYVVVRVYDDEQARENFSNAVMAPQTAGGETAEAIENVMSGELGTPDFTMGQLMIVPGTQVSFYMPSTGMEVVPEDDTTVSNARRYQERPTEGKYVRNAVTLETLQYCILIDENGQKRYERGPAVIFPHPTETFKVNENNSRVFDAIELNEQTGLYVKVIEDYEENGHNYKTGEELFITGKEQAIYFPRAEHNIITYGGKRKHHAIAVPAGEGRYILNRTSGDVELRRGPSMLLPDPRNEVIVRRILDPHDVETMYPGNAEALAVNAIYTQQRDEATTGYLENSEMLRGAKTKSLAGSRYAGNETAVTDSILASNSPGGQNYLGDAMARGTSYSPPRTIVLDTKYEGAVAISIFPGYAVLITDKIGNRRVEVGPKVVLMQYDETIMALSLSTGRPKTDNRLLKTGYLRVVNNVVSDIVTVETKDLVSLNIEVSYRVNFIGDTDEDREKWFGIENYVQVLTDHCRSRLRNAAKHHDILDFYTNAIDIIRDTILGQVVADERPLMTFEENNMQVYDVEILEVTIDDVDVEKLLVGAQSAALEGAIELTVAEQRTAREARLLELRRDSIKEAEKTAIAEAEAVIAAVVREIEAKMEQEKGNVAIRTERLLFEEKARESQRLDAEQRISIQQEEDGVQMMRLTAETTELARRMDALTPGLIQAMVTFGDTVVAERIVTAIAPAAMAAGISTADIMEQVFRDTPFANALTALTHRPLGSGRTAS